MFGLGNGYVPSLSALTAADAAKILRYEAQVKKEMIEDVKIFQKGLGTATTALAKITEDAMNKQAEMERTQATAQMAQGAVGFVQPLAGMGYRGLRESGVSTFDEELSNIQENKNILNGNAAEQPEILALPKDEEEEKGDLINKLEDKLHTTTLSDKPTADTKSNLEITRALRGARKEKAGNLYRDLNKKLDRESENVQSKKQNYRHQTENHIQTMNLAFQGSQNLLGGGLNFMASKRREEQAKLEGIKQQDQYISDNMNMNMQTAQKGFDDANQTINGSAQNYYQGIARANQPV